MPPGSYTVTPSRTGYVFTPSSQSASVTSADVAVAETAYLSARTQLPEKIKLYSAMLKNKS